MTKLTGAIIFAIVVLIIEIVIMAIIKYKSKKAENDVMLKGGFVIKYPNGTTRLVECEELKDYFSFNPFPFTPYSLCPNLELEENKTAYYDKLYSEFKVTKDIDWLYKILTSEDDEKSKIEKLREYLTQKEVPFKDEYLEKVVKTNIDYYFKNSNKIFELAIMQMFKLGNDDFNESFDYFKSARNLYNQNAGRVIDIFTTELNDLECVNADTSKLWAKFVLAKQGKTKDMKNFATYLLENVQCYEISQSLDTSNNLIEFAITCMEKVSEKEPKMWLKLGEMFSNEDSEYEELLKAKEYFEKAKEAKVEDADKKIEDVDKKIEKQLPFFIKAIKFHERQKDFKLDKDLLQKAQELKNAHSIEEINDVCNNSNHFILALLDLINIKYGDIMYCPELSALDNIYSDYYYNFKVNNPIFEFLFFYFYLIEINREEGCWIINEEITMLNEKIAVNELNRLANLGLNAANYVLGDYYKVAYIKSCHNSEQNINPIKNGNYTIFEKAVGYYHKAYINGNKKAKKELKNLIKTYKLLYKAQLKISKITL